MATNPAGKQPANPGVPPTGTPQPPGTAPGGTAPPQKTLTSNKRVRLGDLVLRHDEFSHRSEGAFEPGALQTLLDSIKTEGLRHPPEVHRQDDGTYVVITGHRRVTCLRLLAKDGVAGFSDDMRVEVVELFETTPLDRLAWSVADNEIRLGLTAAERLKVVGKFLKAGMPDERGAYALGLSIKQYKRDLTLARNPWMIDLIDKEAIPATTAVELLDAAGKHDRLMQLKTFLEEWVMTTELEIEAEGVRRNLKPAEKLVRSRLTPELRRHWLDRLAAGKDLDTDVARKVKVDLDPKSLQLAVQGFKLNLKTDPVVEIARVLGTFSQIAKLAIPILKSRAATEAPEGPQAAILSGTAPLYDPDFLRAAGVEDLVEPPNPGLVEELNGNKAADGQTGEPKAG